MSIQPLGCIDPMHDVLVTKLPNACPPTLVGAKTYMHSHILRLHMGCGEAMDTESASLVEIDKMLHEPNARVMNYYLAPWSGCCLPYSDPVTEWSAL